MPQCLCLGSACYTHLTLGVRVYSLRFRSYLGAFLVVSQGTYGAWAHSTHRHQQCEGTHRWLLTCWGNLHRPSPYLGSVHYTHPSLASIDDLFFQACLSAFHGYPRCKMSRQTRCAWVRKCLHRGLGSIVRWLLLRWSSHSLQSPCLGRVCYTHITPVVRTDNPYF